MSRCTLVLTRKGEGAKQLPRRGKKTRVLIVISHFRWLVVVSGNLVVTSVKATGRANGQKNTRAAVRPRLLRLSAGHNPNPQKDTLKSKVIGKIGSKVPSCSSRSSESIHQQTPLLHHILRSDFVSSSSICLFIDLDE